MDTAAHNKLVSFIWSIADDCLRDVYVRGKYRDVILPMVVLRRLDALLEPTKDKVLEEYNYQKENGYTELDDNGLKDASGYVFYNTSKWTLNKLFNSAGNNQQLLLGNVEEYLRGFSSNVKEIVDKFNLLDQVNKMSSNDVLYDVLEKFTSPYINLTPEEAEAPDGTRLPALTNLGMGYVFEELIRKFNEENNEEAGEHFTPREVIDLMTHLVFDPVIDNLPPVMTIFDPACGSGGMLTESQNFIKDPDGKIAAKGDVYLYGKEVNEETYAICKSDMMIKGNNPENIKCGSTLRTDEFSGNSFDFMLSNPPYGKSWSTDSKYIKDGNDIIDPRFKVNLENYWGEVIEEDATPRSSDGQLLFLMEMVSKMKRLGDSPQGSRIASVHNGSSLFTGDAGSGDSNIRRYIIENDLLEAIIQMPNNLFYNTGITTYIWLLSNNKSEEREGKVQLIDANQMYHKLRKNLGNKNCEFSQEDIAEIVKTYNEMLEVDRGAEEEGIASQIFANEDFGYFKVTIERPSRLKAQFTQDRISGLRFDKALFDPMEWAYNEFGEDIYTDIKQYEKQILKWCEDNELDIKAKAKSKLLNIKTWEKQKAILEGAEFLLDAIGDTEYSDFNELSTLVDAKLKEAKIKLSAAEKKQILNAVSWYDSNAEKVIDKKFKWTDSELKENLEYYDCSMEQLSDFGYYPTGKRGEYITYVGDTELRDSESVPYAEEIHPYFLREVKPHVDEAWVDIESVKCGCEISFNKYFYKHKPLRSIEEVAQDIMAIENSSEGLIAKIIGGVE